MTQELSHEFARLLDQYDDKRRVVEERKRQVKADEEAFRSGFTEKSSRVVRPIFEAVGVILRQRGHDFTILEEQHSAGLDGKTQEAAISIRIMPAGVEKTPHGEALFPSLSFTTRQYNKTVCIRGSNSLPSSTAPGSKKDYQLSEIDNDLVQAQLLQLIAGMVGK
jgi:hypothetical protein